VRGRHAPPAADEVEGWVNLNSFLARIWKAFDRTTTAPLRLDFYASLALRSALEGISSFSGGRRREGDRKTDGALDCDMAVAAEWIEHAGSAIYAAGYGKDGGEPADERVISAGGLYHGPQGLCEEHWEFWKMRFGEISTEDGVSEDSKALALNSKLTMESLETIVNGY
jgi:Protein of unknown function (DUF3632)